MTTYIYPPIDTAPSDVYGQFTTAMETLIPGWEAGKGNLDDFIALAFATIIAQLGEITSDVATSIYRYFGAFIANLQPISAAPAVGTVNFTLTNPAPSGTGLTIPAGTSLLFTDPTGNSQGFSTTAVATAAPSATGINGVPVIADFPGAVGNNVTGIGYCSLATVQSVSLQAPTSNGTDAEDDDAYLGRLRQLYTILSPKAVVASDFSTLALQQPGVGRAVTLDGFDPGNLSLTVNLTSGSVTATNLSVSVSAIPVGAPVTGANIPAGTFVKGTVPASSAFIMSNPASANATGQSVVVTGSLMNGGEVTTVVTDASGNALPPTAQSTVQAALAAGTLDTFKVNVQSPTYTTINVAATVYAWPGQNVASIQSAVQAAIQNYINQATWGQPPFGQAAVWFNEPVVRYASVEHAILSVPGVHYVAGLTLNGGATDVALPGVVPLPQCGTVGVTINLG